MNFSANLHSPIDIADQQRMQRALAVARKGIALASPNPYVGALVVDPITGEVLGSGTHTYDGKKHAEILALQQAGERARGKTLYLNLEPCSHQGRTGPCADALIQAGVRRVVAAIEDPNPQVAGKGFAKLRSAGIEVVVGVCEAEARYLNEAFAKYIRTRKPLVILKSAMTLDGKIASGRADSEPTSSLHASGTTTSWITGEAARAHVHQLRHAADAILVGVGTVLADDPLLTDRTGLPRRRPLLRVILDSHLRLSPESRLVKTAQDDLLVICSSPDSSKRRELEAHGVQVKDVQVKDVPPGPGGDGRPDLDRVAQYLGELEITSLLIEGGAMVNGAALAAGICDKVFFFYAPKILGSSRAVPFAEGAGFRGISEAISVKDLRLHRLGEDFAVEGYLRDPYDL